MIYIDLDDLLHETQLQRHDERIAAAIGQPALAPPTMVLLAPVDPGWPSGEHDNGVGNEP